MASTYLLEIVTPDRMFFDDEVEMLVVRTTEGDIGVLNDHQPEVAPLKIGRLKVKTKTGEMKIATCSSGFINITEEKTTVVTDSAEWESDIDVDRAKSALNRAQERLNSSSDEVDVARAKSAFYRATNRLHVANKTIDHSSL